MKVDESDRDRVKKKRVRSEVDMEVEDRSIIQLTIYVMENNQTWIESVEKDKRSQKVN